MAASVESLLTKHDVSLDVEEFITLTVVVTSTAVALLAGDVDTMVGDIVSGFTVTCLRVQDRS